MSPLPFLPESALTESFFHASGPGGQHVNKVATAVLLRVNLTILPDAVRARLIALAGRKITYHRHPAGELLLTARRHRTQQANRTEARTRLAALLAAALIPPMPRHATRPTRGSVRRHTVAKKIRAGRKATRRTPTVVD